MKAISYEEWQRRFMITNDPDEAEWHIKDEPDAYTFFSNGAVSHTRSGDYVIKLDQVERIAQ